MTVTVTTQAELDAAIGAGESDIIIDSPAGVWLKLQTASSVVAWGSSSVVAWGSSSVVARGSSSVVARGSSSVVAWDSSSVVAWDSSRVDARDSSSVVAWDSSRVDARGSSSVVAWDSSRVDAWDSSLVVARGSSRVVARGSSSVVAWGSSSVVAWDSSLVVAWDSSSVVAWDSSRVDARDSSSVDARDSSSVDARDSSSVVAWGSSLVDAGSHVAVHLHSQRATVVGGVVIDITALDLTDTATWLAYTGIKPDPDGQVTLYKAVDADLDAGQMHQLTRYPIGETVTAPDWEPTSRCGGGLHFGTTPQHADMYFNGSGRPRYLEVTVAVEDLRPIDDKVKARACTVVREVNAWREPISADAVVAS